MPLITSRSSDPAIQAALEAIGAEFSEDTFAGLRFRLGERWVCINSKADCCAPFEFGLPSVVPAAVGWPSPTATLVMLSIWPLAQAGWILEPPGVLSSEPGEITHELEQCGWPHGADVMLLEGGEPGMVAVTVLAHIVKLDHPDMIDQIFAAAFARAPWITIDDESDWSPEILAGRDLVFRVRYSPGENTDLLRLQWIARTDGRLGASGQVQFAQLLSG